MASPTTRQTAAKGAGRSSRRQSKVSGDEAELPRSPRVLLLVDFINPLQFDGAEDLAPAALRAARATAALKRRLGAEGVRTLYVNDNFGRWRSDFRGLLSTCRALPGVPGQLARLLKPGADDLMVLKPRHSAFHATPLDLLLERLRARELILTGLATDFCVACTAMDAHVRGYKLWVPADCTAAESEGRHAQSLQWMADVLKARTRPAGDG